MKEKDSREPKNNGYESDFLRRRQRFYFERGIDKSLATLVSMLCFLPLSRLDPATGVGAGITVLFFAGFSTVDILRSAGLGLRARVLERK